MYGRGSRVWETSVLSAQFCCAPKTGIQNKVYLKGKKKYPFATWAKGKDLKPLMTKKCVPLHSDGTALSSGCKSVCSCSSTKREEEKYHLFFLLIILGWQSSSFCGWALNNYFKTGHQDTAQPPTSCVILKKPFKSQWASVYPFKNHRGWTNDLQVFFRL